MTTGTGTCNLSCWMAEQDVCRCMCGGRNHGIMRHGGAQPGRFCQRKGKQYRLHAICDSWYEARQTASQLSKDLNERYGLSRFTQSAFEQSASGHMLRWPEVEAAFAQQAAKGNARPDAYLVWGLYDMAFEEVRDLALRQLEAAGITMAKR